MTDNVARSSRSVKRAFAILELLDRSQRRWNISEISRKLRIPKSTTHVLMLTLEMIGYVTQDEQSHRYYLALKARDLGNETRLRETLSTVSLRDLEALAAQTKLTVHVAMQEEQQAVYIQKVAGPRLVQFDTYPGRRANLHCTAVGKVLLAYVPPDFTARFLAKVILMKHTPSTITSTAYLQKELEKIRRQGYAVDDEEEELDVRCLAVPIFRKSGECVAALSVAGTTSQIEVGNFSSLVAIMKRTSNQISKSLWPF